MSIYHKLKYGSEAANDGRLVWFILILCIVWFALGVTSCNNIRHILTGETVDAQVVSVRPYNRTKNRKQRYEVSFSYTDTKLGETVRSKMTIDHPSVLPNGGTQIKIDYFPGYRNSAQIARERPWLLPTLFIGMTALGIGALILAGNLMKKR